MTDTTITEYDWPPPEERCSVCGLWLKRHWRGRQCYSLPAKLNECSAGADGPETAPIESDVPSVVSAPNETCSTRTADHAASTAAAKISMR